MIVSRTPFRVSFFGGGTDFPQWYEKNDGHVISTTINKYCYINLRNLPPFFNYNYSFRYRQTENLKHYSQTEHPSIKQCLKSLI